MGNLSLNSSIDGVYSTTTASNDKKITQFFDSLKFTPSKN